MEDTQQAFDAAISIPNTDFPSKFIRFVLFKLCLQCNLIINDLKPLYPLLIVTGKLNA